MFDQKINCDVKMCKHNNAEECACELSSITVVNDRRTPTACEQYENIG